MCGRFVSTTVPDRLADYFGAVPLFTEALGPDYNVAPTRQVYLIRAGDGERVIDLARWGFLPPWAKSLDDRPQPINARSETVAEKRMFKSAFLHRRGLVAADGFYEWKKEASGPKTPFYIRATTEEPLAFAAIWGTWRSGSSDTKSADEPAEIKSCTILTTAPNGLMAPIHDRMPVIISPADFNEWLDPANEDLAELGDLLVPAPDGLLEAWPVGRRVNNVRENGADLIERV